MKCTHNPRSIWFWPSHPIPSNPSFLASVSLLFSAAYKIWLLQGILALFSPVKSFFFFFTLMWQSSTDRTGQDSPLKQGAEGPCGQSQRSGAGLKAGPYSRSGCQRISGLLFWWWPCRCLSTPLTVRAHQISQNPTTTQTTVEPLRHCFCCICFFFSQGLEPMFLFCQWHAVGPLRTRMSSTVCPTTVWKALALPSADLFSLLAASTTTSMVAFVIFSIIHILLG